MKGRRDSLYLIFIVIAAIAAAVFIYPKGWGKQVRPWKLGLDLVGGSHLVYEVDLAKVATGDRDSVLNGLRDVIESRVNNFGVSEPQIFIAKSGDSAQLVVELAGVKNISDAIAQIGETPLLDFRTVLEVSATGTVPAGLPEEACVTTTSGKTCFLPTDVTGRYITGAQMNFNQTTRVPEVSLSFNEDGGKLFEDLTAANVGKPIAVFLDGQPIEVATVREKISNGQAVISSDRFTITDAQKLVERFNAGALPAPITLINQQTVGPNLGADSLKATIIAGAVGTGLVMLFMLIYYGLLGIFASIALIIYIIFTLAIFKVVPITLTLAGLAGFILTIGMAVDANILTFERVKEEIAKGLPRKTALEEGFRRSWPSIRDSNASTMITAIILYFFTSSFVRGFALTLLLGVVMSMFSAITTTRILLRVFSKQEQKKS